MRIQLIEGKEDYFWDSFESLYQEAFPDYERRPLPDLIRLLENAEGRYHLLSIAKDERFVGFFGLWCFEKFIYVEHFAVLSEARGMGIGTEALNLLLQKENVSFVLEVEPPIDEQTRRRVAFYEKIGFRMSNVFYWQPPYSPSLDGLELRLMFYCQEEMPAIREVIQTIYAVVYNYSCLGS